MENAQEIINSVNESMWDIEKFTSFFYPEQVKKPASVSYGFKFVYIKPLSEAFAEELVGELE